LIRHRAGKLALWTNPFSPAEPVKMIEHGGQGWFAEGKPSRAGEFAARNASNSVP
jgi:hypothetical protein